MILSSLWGPKSHIYNTDTQPSTLPQTQLRYVKRHGRRHKLLQQKINTLGPCRYNSSRKELNKYRAACQRNNAAAQSRDISRCVSIVSSSVTKLHKKQPRQFNNNENILKTVRDCLIRNLGPYLTICIFTPASETSTAQNRATVFISCSNSQNTSAQSGNFSRKLKRSLQQKKSVRCNPIAPRKRNLTQNKLYYLAVITHAFDWSAAQKEARKHLKSFKAFIRLNHQESAHSSACSIFAFQQQKHSIKQPN